jgi:hypothetical protein
MSLNSYKYEILDELFNHYCFNKKIDYILIMLENYPNRYYAILDGKIVLNHEIIAEGDLSSEINPYLFSKRFNLLLTHEDLTGTCCKCYMNTSLVRLNCDIDHYLCLKCLKLALTLTGLCFVCNDELILHNCIINIHK